MSINRDMKKCILQRNSPVRTASGAERESWKRVGEIRVAIYKKNEMKSVASEKYMKSTHTGLTYSRDIQAGRDRIVKDGVAYGIVDCNPDGRLTNLILEVIANA